MMKQRYYAAENNKSILQITVALGRNKINISVGNSKLDWLSIDLNEEQVKEFRKFIKETDI